MILSGLWILCVSVVKGHFFDPADEKDREKFSYLKEMSNFAYKQKIYLL